MRNAPTIIQRLLRERVLGRYLAALEQGDLATVASIMRRAERDAVLEELIFEIHETYQTEEEFLLMIQREEQHMEPDHGIHKSRLKGSIFDGEQEVPLELEPQPSRHKPGRYARAWQVLAAVLLVGVLGSGYLLAQSHRAPASASRPARNSWCTTPGQKISMANQGAAQSMLQGQNIAALASDNAWLVGSATKYDTPLIQHWDGRNWSMVQPAALPTGVKEQDLLSIAAISADNIWAVGGSLFPDLVLGIADNLPVPLIEHWDGQQWRIVPGPSVPGTAQGLSYLSKVVAFSADDVWAAGIADSLPLTSDNYNAHAFPILEHWDGKSWRLVNLPATFSPGYLDTIAGTSAHDLWLLESSVGQNMANKPILAHWDGSQWRVVQLPDGVLPQRAFINTIIAISPTDVWIAGAAANSSAVNSPYHPIVAHWDGQQWSSALSQTELQQLGISDGGLSSIYAAGADDIWVTGDVASGTPTGSNDTLSPLLLHWDGKHWSKTAFLKIQGGGFDGLAGSNGKLWLWGSSYDYQSQTIADFLTTNC